VSSASQTRIDLHPKVTLQRISPPGQHYFFGYYDKCPWDATSRYLLAMRSDFFHRQPEPGEQIVVGMFDLREGTRFIELDRTAAWSWQQGTMLQWVGPTASNVIYNTFDGRDYRSTIRNVLSGQTRTLPRPVYHVSADGRQAVTLNFDRVHRLRPGYGYAAFPDRTAADPAPADAGIFWMNLATGDNKLILPIGWAAAHRPRPDMAGAHHWFNHLYFNPSGGRFIFLHRWRQPGGKSWWTRLYTSDPAGKEPRLLLDDDMTSHFEWRDDRTILAWACVKVQGDHYYLIDDQTAAVEQVGSDTLTADGHCTYSPDRRWILTDTYPDWQTHLRTLLLYAPATGRRTDLGRFYAPPGYPVECRCDLHPRFNRDASQICIDSLHEGFRGMYLLDVAAITKS
jgi:hypothetical protein